jgi:hypothetical protein
MKRKRHSEEQIIAILKVQIGMHPDNRDFL